MSSATLNEPISIRLAPDQRSELEALAHATSRELSDLIQEAIAAYIDEQREEMEAIREGLRQADAGEFASDEEVASIYARWR